MSLGIFFGYVAMSLFFFTIFEEQYKGIPLRMLFIISICWPVSVIVLGLNHIVDYLTSKDD